MLAVRSCLERAERRRHDGPLRRGRSTLVETRVISCRTTRFFDRNPEDTRGGTWLQ
jgi:hypothetical protein